MESSYCRIAWLLAYGKIFREVAEVTDYTEKWVRKLSRRERGAEGLGDRPQAR